MTRSLLADALVVADDVRRHYESVMPDLIAFYEREGRVLTDEKLMIALNTKFGERLIAEVCEPLGFFQGACVFIGTVLLRQLDRASGHHRLAVRGERIGLNG